MRNLRTGSAALLCCAVLEWGLAPVGTGGEVSPSAHTLAQAAQGGATEAKGLRWQVGQFSRARRQAKTTPRARMPFLDEPVA